MLRIKGENYDKRLGNTRVTLVLLIFAWLGKRKDWKDELWRGKIEENVEISYSKNAGGIAKYYGNGGAEVLDDC